MNRLIKDLMVETVRQAREFSRIADATPHASLRGQLRESLVARALRPWLPQGVELTTGVIVDEDGTARSVGEDDIIVYCPSLLPAMLPLVERNIVLLDAVVMRIEIKSTLSAAQLRSAIEGAISVDRLKTSYKGRREVHALFAYRSTASVRSELARMKQQAAALGWTKTEHPPISLVCVDNKECYMHGKVGDGQVGWYDLAPEAPADATVAFISTVASCVAEIRDTRQSVQISRFVTDVGRSRLMGDGD